MNKKIEDVRKWLERKNKVVKYKFIGTEQDLIDNGFYLYDDSDESIADGDYVRDVDEDVQLYISLRFKPFKRKIMNNYGPRDLLKEEHIQDLIDLELVKVYE